MTAEPRRRRKRSAPTFTEQARRAQIVEAAIETIAELGYAGASYAQIAKRAGISSTGLISYHFAGKDDLIEEVVAAVVSAGQAFMLPRIAAAADTPGRLRAYIESNLEFMDGHRAHIVAVVQVFNAFPRGRDGQPGPYVERHERGLAQLEALLRDGQRTGELGEFSARVMAIAIRAAIDAVGRQLADDPDLDVNGTARELAALFDRATGSKA